MSGEQSTKPAVDPCGHDDILRKAWVPEHSALFMQAMSGGTAFVHGDFLFLAGDGWLTGIGYPLEPAGYIVNSGTADAGSLLPDFRFASEPAFLSATSTAFASAIEGALEEAARRELLKASSCPGGKVDIFAVAPDFTDSLRQNVTERDTFYLLPVGSGASGLSDLPGPYGPSGSSCSSGLSVSSVSSGAFGSSGVPGVPCVPGVPDALRRHVRQAASCLRVEEGQSFTPAHRRLWSEFLARPDMRSNVREMYAKTEALLRLHPEGITLLDTIDSEGRLAASLLLDFAPSSFCSYIIGAHSRRFYTPHATDLLFARMLELARQRGKAYIHLGLGVNEGIARFKRKWGAVPRIPFQMAAWQADLPDTARSGGMLGGLMRGLASMPSGESKQQIFNSLPPQKPYAMLWELEKNGRRSWIGGTAHFFQCTFEHSFEKLFEKVDNVIFEGPLDPDSLAHFEQSGRTRLPGDPCLYDMLTPDDLDKLRRMVRGPEGGLHRLLNHEAADKADVDDYLRNTRPWFAFFSLWTAFLERHGWRQSVDLDAWNQAKDMGKAVIAMENREEQLASLESVPPERIISFFRNCHDWPRRMRQNLKTYLLGDLGGMAGTSTEFPTRIHSVIGMRDHRFCERMMPFITQGRSMVFVGSAHMIGLRVLLAEHGFKVAKVSPGFSHKIRTFVHARLNKDADLV
ncbi:GNAT family N-acetyltransferase [Desulfovibrio sp. OttesenSCG-928-C06]|nr:GNAT family N-acetyltransferase [Desulfovibrio sp. OttesenSCG-928-C06]